LAKLAASVYNIQVCTNTVQNEFLLFSVHGYANYVKIEHNTEQIQTLHTMHGSWLNGNCILTKRVILGTKLCRTAIFNFVHRHQTIVITCQPL